MDQREIKFRAWDSRLKVMVATGFHVIGEVTMFNMIEMHIHENKKEGEATLDRIGDIIITQFTGLKDNSGKAIYEGDIIQYVPGVNYVVEWWEEGAAWRPKLLTHIGITYGTTFKTQIAKYEVIGNIFQNSELIP
jgi:hypothetical protein